MYKSVVIAFVLLCAGCADMNSQAVNGAQHKISEVCLYLNKQAATPDFKYVLKESFLRHGITMRDYTKMPASCDYWVSYHVTLRKKHSLPSLRDVHLALYKGPALIAYADRDSPQGFLGKEVGDLSQWDSTRSIIEPLVDRLLATETQQTAPLSVLQR